MTKRWTQELVSELLRDRKTMTLRALGVKHGVAHERIRQILCKEARRLRREGMGFDQSQRECGLRI